MVDKKLIDTCNQHTNSTQAPLVSALLRYKGKKDISFHVPGHKNGEAYSYFAEANEIFGPILEIDVTEIEGTDNLHQPEGAILEAQKYAARFFGADQTFFLVGGSTAGNQALILSVCTNPGDIILVQRNVHKSVIHGLMLAHAKAVFLTPEIDQESGLATIPSITTIQRALKRYPNAKGILLTQPNYYGMVSSTLANIVELCHSYHIPVFVDEAHGAHFGLHVDFPNSALHAGVDGVVQSTHKMLSAMTMGSMLHIQGEYIERTLLAQRLTMIQSSSPSYPIMASLDSTRFMLEVHGGSIFAEPLIAAQMLRDGIGQLKRYRILNPDLTTTEPQRAVEQKADERQDDGCTVDELKEDGRQADAQQAGAQNVNSAYDKQDPLKIVICDALGIWSGYELQNRLCEMGCIPEMCDERYVVFALGQGTTTRDVDRLLAALEQLSMEETENKANDFFTWNNWLVEEEGFEPVQFSLSVISDENTEMIPLEQGVGRRSAEMIIPYPPGIPLLYPQELITEHILKRIMQLRELNATSLGACDPSLKMIKVCKL
ncbi:aminotransferase class I/II-fold pyridoxal phosphate-dependent enzyme [Microbacterium sp. NPDC096154]|jgi:arginine/lysine/ornithine decarboxylase|uniref:aminotransferase class I/II-fold pyridoxal phosphate-dependent enzyme n=1 Tax=Microbacterium sp. NPDC096154 TaxID=3155549 RepID=UPI00332406FF